MITHILESLRKNPESFLKTRIESISYAEILTQMQLIDLSIPLGCGPTKPTVIALNVKNPILFVILLLKLLSHNHVVLPASSWDYDALVSICRKYKVDQVWTDEQINPIHFSLE